MDTEPALSGNNPSAILYKAVWSDMPDENNNQMVNDISNLVRPSYMEYDLPDHITVPEAYTTGENNFVQYIDQKRIHWHFSCMVKQVSEECYISIPQDSDHLTGINLKEGQGIWCRACIYGVCDHCIDKDMKEKGYITLLPICTYN